MARRRKTALKKFERLESLALWRSEPDAHRREVTLSFGMSSLIITDHAERPLGHWSLATIERLNPGGSPALYAPDSEASETLEIEDNLMVEARETVRKAIGRKRPKRGRLRLTIALSASVLIVAAVFLALPKTLRDQASRSLPSATRAEISQLINEELWKTTGRPCSTAFSENAIIRLQERLFEPSSANQITFVKFAGDDVWELPDGTFVVGSALVEDFDTPHIVAGFIAAAILEAERTPAIDAFVNSLRVVELIDLLTSGTVSGQAAARFARQMITAPSALKVDDAFIDFAQEKELALSALIGAVTPLEGSSEVLNEAVNNNQAVATPIMSDGDWVALQAICEDRT